MFYSYMQVFLLVRFHSLLFHLSPTLAYYRGTSVCYQQGDRRTTPRTAIPWTTIPGIVTKGATNDRVTLNCNSKGLFYDLPSS